jgi:hypothetical protein
MGVARTDDDEGRAGPLVRRRTTRASFRPVEKAA